MNPQPIQAPLAPMRSLSPRGLRLAPRLRAVDLPQPAPDVVPLPPDSPASPVVPPEIPPLEPPPEIIEPPLPGESPIHQPIVPGELVAASSMTGVR